MTANILSTELGNIIQDSKKKNGELRNAAEQALRELKALPATSEAQLAADLKRRPHIVNPFLTACSSRNARLTLSAISCLQRLVVSNGLAEERLKEVLEAFQDSTPISLEVQLKILQCLPSISQNYSAALQGDVLASVLQICTTLQQAKSSAVSSTASATLQQIVSLVFESVEADDGSPIDTTALHDIVTSAGTLSVRSPAYDAYVTFQDVCLLTDGQQSQYMRKATISPSFGLELIETILLNHADILHSHAEQSHLLLTRVMPMVNRVLSEKSSFAITVRIVRILCILVREHMQTVASECEIALSLLNHSLEAGAATPWRRAVAMEAFRVIYSSSDVLLEVYSTLDGPAGKTRVIQDNLASFVRLAAEKPALIGLGQQSSTPATQSTARPSSSEQGVLEAEAAVGIIGSDYGVNETNVPGISAQWSSMIIPCLDQLDKSDGPPIPETYIYSLVLTCINCLSDALAKVVLPMAMQNQRKSTRKARSPAPPESTTQSHLEEPHQAKATDHRDLRPPPANRQRARSVFVNPLDLKEHSEHASVAVVAGLINDCWPAVLATSSTFFNAALDTDFYRSLVRSFQKFAQVAGILRLATPRDALLTTLAKAAVPPQVLTSEALMSPPASLPRPSLTQSFQGLMTSPSETTSSSSLVPDSPSKSRRSSFDESRPTLTQRNMMCLRALVHLAIALGPILDHGWEIVLESIQKANVLLAASGTVATARDYRSNNNMASEPQYAQSTLASEISAVEGAVNKLFVSTADYPTDAFKVVLMALCKLLGRQDKSEPSFSLKPPPKVSKRVPSISGLAASTSLQPQYAHFTIAKLGELAKVNMRRLAQSPSADGWDLLMGTLTEVSTSHEVESVSRQMAADVLCKVAAGASISTASEESDVREKIQHRSFVALRAAVARLHDDDRNPLTNADLDVHQLLLSSLGSILEHCGEAIVTGWELMFSIVNSIFVHQPTSTTDGMSVDTPKDADVAKPLSAKLAKSGFAAVQLICSDFLDTLPQTSLITLIDILSRFCSQRLDVNISLSVVTLFWNISDQLRAHTDIFERSSQPAQAFKRSSGSPSELLGSQAEKGSLPAVWMVLLRRLATLTNDERADVRNGSVQVLYRTLESCGDKLTASLWEAVFPDVLFHVLEIDASRQRRSRKSESDVDDGTRKSLNQSSRITVQGIETLMTTFNGAIRSLEAFSTIWDELLDRFESYLARDSYELYDMVYASISRMLTSPTEDNRSLDLSAVNQVASLWANHVPRCSETPENHANSQDRALIAYVATIKRIHALSQSDVKSKQIDIIVERLEEVIRTSKATSYTNDVNKETQLQAETLQTFDLLLSRPVDIPRKTIEGLAGFVVLPYAHQDQKAPVQQGLTHVAFAKEAMKRLCKALTEDVKPRQTFESLALAIVLDALATSIEKKYTWKIQGKDPTLWRKATSSALAIIEHFLPATTMSSALAQHKESVWKRIVRIGEAILGAEYENGIEPSDDILDPDETFDLAAFETYRGLVTPYLDSSAVTETTRLAYVAVLHRASTLHPSRFDDIDASDAYAATYGPPSSPIFSTTLNDEELLQPRAPALDKLHTIRRGLVYDPPFSPRLRVCYAALDRLFDLVSTSANAANTTDNAPEATPTTATTSPDQAISATGNLATTSLPFLLHRTATPLKRYIADQPLRGRFPTPASQRLELLYVLDKLATLELEAARGTGGEGRRHLMYLAPLVTKALAVVPSNYTSVSNQEIKEGLLRVLDVYVGAGAGGAAVAG